MVNAALIACEIASLLPSSETPSHTSGREGFYHLCDMQGDVASSKLNYIVRDHDKDTFESRLNRLRTIEVDMNQKYGSGTVHLQIDHSYENMISVINDNYFVVNRAKKAIESVGLEPISRPVRGGTDGARLSFEGLPCPNIFAGGENFHSRYEYLPILSMENAMEVILQIVQKANHQ